MVPFSTRIAYGKTILQFPPIYKQVPPSTHVNPADLSLLRRFTVQSSDTFRFVAFHNIIVEEGVYHSHLNPLVTTSSSFEKKYLIAPLL